MSTATSGWAAWLPTCSAGRTPAPGPTASPAAGSATSSSPAFGRLRDLDLSECWMSDAAARRLAEADLKHLKRLNVEGNSLTGDGIQALRATGVPLEVGSQNDPEEIPF